MEMNLSPVATVCDRRRFASLDARPRSVPQGSSGRARLRRAATLHAQGRTLLPIRGAHAPSRARFGASQKHSARKKSALAGARSPAREARALPRQEPAFTLIELLVVIVIIAILMGLAFPVFQGIQNQAKKVQAKNDLMQIVTAVNAFYTEYGKYPLPAGVNSDASATFGSANPNKVLFDELRGITNTLNTRQIVFISPPEAKDPASPRSGVAGSASSKAGQYFDPWGTAYFVSIDWDYDNQVLNPYTADTGAGAAQIRTGVLAWSLGKDQKGGTAAKTSTDSNDDIISWQ